MLNLQDIKRAREKVHRRLAIIEQAVKEYDEVVDRFIEQANTEVISRPLKVVEMAKILEVTPRTVGRWGANKCESYADLVRWLKANREDLLTKVEKNYQQFIKDKK